MSSYIKEGKPLEYDNAPDWLVAYMQYRRAVLGNTRTSVMTFFGALREFCQWVKMYTSGSTQPKSVERLRQVDILDLEADTVAERSKNDIETYLYFLTDVLGNDPKTRNKKLVAIRCMYDYFLDQKQPLGLTIGENPTQRIPNPKVARKQPVYLPGDDQGAFLEGISGENGVRDYALFLLILSSGLRVSEAVGINLKDLDLNNAVCRIRGKGNKERIVHITPPCCAALKRYMSEYRDLIPGLETDALFVSRRYVGRLTTRSVQKAMQKHTLNAELGGKGYTPHKLRHTAATTLAKDGVDLLAIQQVLGHESPATTEIYTHLGSEDVAKAVRNSSLVLLGTAPIRRKE